MKRAVLYLRVSTICAPPVQALSEAARVAYLSRIRNVWSCRACGYQFEDTVYLSPRRELADAE